jgi:hypothetical protein
MTTPEAFELMLQALKDALPIIEAVAKRGRNVHAKKNAALRAKQMLQAINAAEEVT